MSIAVNDAQQLLRDLRLQVARLELALGATSEAVLWTDPAGRIEWCNEAFAVLAGCSRDELLGKPFRKALRLEAEGAPVPADAHPTALAARGELFPPRCYEVLRGSVLAAWEIYGRPVLNGGEKGLLFVLREATEEKRRDAEHRRLHAEMEEKVKALGHANRELETFNYSISHDLRGPVNAIQCVAALLAQDPLRKFDVKELESLKSILRMSDRMMALIEGLLSLSGIGHREPQVGAIDMGALAAEVIAELQASASGRSVAWTLQPLPAARGDRAMVRQVLQNLLSNALKYTGRREKAEISIGARAEERRVVYWVRDNGAGFDPARTDKLFQPFQRLHTRYQFDGTGIGLTIVKRVVEKHGGEAWAEGRPGEGATFSFSLPPA